MSFIAVLRIVLLIGLPAYAVFALYAATKRRFAHLLILTSAVGHVVAMAVLGIWAQLQPPTAKPKPMELVMIDVKPPPPPPPPEEEKTVEPPPPPKKPPPIKVAKVDPPKEIPKEEPPPPNEEPPPEETKPKVVVVGISMSSTSTTGTFNAPVGNTQYGKVADTAAKPEDVKPYSAPKYMPSYQVDSQPEVISDFKPEYPPEARKAGIEGTVIIQITVDHEGRVTNLKLVRGLGYGLDEAALQSLRKFRFKPAVKGGEPVSTTINYNFNFWLE